MNDTNSLRPDQAGFLLRLRAESERRKCFTWLLYNSQLICASDPTGDRLADVPYQLVFYKALQSQGWLGVTEIDVRSPLGTDQERAEIEVLPKTMDCADLEQQMGGTMDDALSDSLSSIERIIDGFHSVVKQLRDRHGGRLALKVDDEYDVQYLLHALLRIYFDDIRPEEWTPSHAGASSRMDFLLKQERIVIETKKTRDGLGDREIGDQLIVDIGRYRSHPDCRILVCFVYDPDSKVKNPKAIENDISRKDGLFEVKVLVRP